MKAPVGRQWALDGLQAEQKQRTCVSAVGAVTDGMCMSFCPNKTVRLSPMRAMPSLTYTHLQRRINDFYKLLPSLCHFHRHISVSCAVIHTFPRKANKTHQPVYAAPRHKPNVELYLLNWRSFLSNYSHYWYTHVLLKVSSYLLKEIIQTESSQSTRGQLILC